MLVGERPIVGLTGGTPRGGMALDKALRAQGVSHRSERIVKETVGRALAAEPDDRFAAVDEFAARLRETVGRRLGPRPRPPPLPGKAGLLGGATGPAPGTRPLGLVGGRAPPLDPGRGAGHGVAKTSRGRHPRP